MSWESNFKDSTTNVAFNLQLSRHMVSAMNLVYDYELRITPDLSMPLFVPAVKNLISRGLVEHHDIGAEYDSMTDIEKMSYKLNHRWYTFTPAGKHVFNLLVLAGLITRPRLVVEDVV